MAISASGYNTTIRQNALYMDVARLTAPDYCNMSGPVHWDYGPGVEWTSPQCAAHYELNEFVDASTGDAWIYTNFVQRGIVRSCQTPASLSNVTMQDPVEQATLIVLPANCSTDLVLYNNFYIYQPETVSLTLSPSWGTSWTHGKPFDSLTVMSQKGVPLGTAFQFQDVMTLTLQNILDAAGVTLDMENKDSGGKGLFDGSTLDNQNSGTTWPSYRTTGLALRARLRVTNFRAKSPINFNVTGELFVDVASAGAWTAAPLEIDYWGPADQTFDSVWLERRQSGVHIEFVEEGQMGRPDGLTALNAILNTFVVSLIAVALTDIAGLLLSETFAGEKYDDDGEREAVNSLLEKEAVRAAAARARM